MSTDTISLSRDAAVKRDVERRLYERRNIYIPLVFTATGPGSRRIEGRGTTVNISAGGAFFLCRDGGIEPGMRLEMVLSPEAALVHDKKMALTAVVLGVYRFRGVDGEPCIDRGVAVKFGQLWEFDWPEEISRACGSA